MDFWGRMCQIVSTSQTKRQREDGGAYGQTAIMRFPAEETSSEEK